VPYSDVKVGYLRGETSLLTPWNPLWLMSD